ncbi:MAG: hypothetical protein AAF429_08065 [Pseudomonadota bacterium]
MTPTEFLLADILNSRSFFSIWYWIFLAVTWAHLTHFSLGIGYHDVRHADRVKGQAMQDLETIVAINLRNTLPMLKNHGAILVGIMAFMLSVFLTIGLAFDFELMQAIGLFWFFLCILGIFSWQFLMRLEADTPKGTDLVNAFKKHRLIKKIVGFVALFVTAIYGLIIHAFDLL